MKKLCIPLLMIGMLSGCTAITIPISPLMMLLHNNQMEIPCHPVNPMDIPNKSHDKEFKTYNPFQEMTAFAPIILDPFPADPSSEFVYLPSDHTL